jgi:methylated-DNA-[protein]-cysteine S-methyltransferase
MDFISTQTFKSPVGELIVGVHDSKLCMCDWRYRRMRSQIDARIKKLLSAEYVEQPHDLIDETLAQLEAYFQQRLKVFDLPLTLAGTSFQQSVWEALIKIPYGETSTYKALSELMEKPDAIRAVASANGANAISIIVPCHRIIGSDGSLVGYAGGLRAKKSLLEMEQGVLAAK